MPTPPGGVGITPLMSNSFIRNREGRIIARVDGTILRDGTGKIVAAYHPAENLTRERSGRIVGTGNQVLRVLGETQRRK